MSLVADLEIRLGSFELALSMRLDEGEVVAVMGPNGAGKSTLIRALAGLHGIDAGHIELDGFVFDDPASGRFVPPERRPVGVVFQDYLLFPHLSVLDNVAFGRRARGVSKGVANAEALGWIDRVGLAELASARPGRISGGQAQRVALARALATEPRLLLLDEPLAALDLDTRASVRRDLRRHLGEFKGATVLVTHDPLDAFALADRIAVIEGGRLTQMGTLAEITARPRRGYVAALLGVNLLRGVAEDHSVRLDGGARVAAASAMDGPTMVLIRPRSVALHSRRPDSSARNQWCLVVEGHDALGDCVLVRLGGELALVAEITPSAFAELQIADGDTIWASVKATDITTYPA